MPHQPKFKLIFAPEAIDHLCFIEYKYHRLIEEAIDKQLTCNPKQVTRNRKPLEQPAPFGAAWELRCGPANRIRVFYEVDITEQVVWVLAIGIKERNRLWVRGKEFMV